MEKWKEEKILSEKEWDEGRFLRGAAIALLEQHGHKVWIPEDAIFLGATLQKPVPLIIDGSRCLAEIAYQEDHLQPRLAWMEFWQEDQEGGKYGGYIHLEGEGLQKPGKSTIERFLKGVFSIKKHRDHLDDAMYRLQEQDRFFLPFSLFKEWGVEDVAEGEVKEALCQVLKEVGFETATQTKDGIFVTAPSDEVTEEPPKNEGIEATHLAAWDIGYCATCGHNSQEGLCGVNHACPYMTGKLPVPTHAKVRRAGILAADMAPYEKQTEFALA